MRVPTPVGRDEGPSDHTRDDDPHVPRVPRIVSDDGHIMRDAVSHVCSPG